MTGKRSDVVSEDILKDLRKARTLTPRDLRRHLAQKMPTTRTAYGLGWRTYDYAGYDVVAHSGSVEGYSAQIAYIPSRGTGIAILSNTRGARTAKLVPTWLDHELGLERGDWLKLEDAFPEGEPEDSTFGENLLARER